MRLLPVALLLSASVLALSACSATPDPVASDSPTPEPSITVSTDATGLSFEDGQLLSTDIASAPVFLNGFAADGSGWTEQDGTDPTQGNWVYLSEDGTCTVRLSQIASSDATFEVVPGDDAVSSVSALAWYFRDSEMVDQVTAGAVDTTVPYGDNWAIGDPSVEFKGVSAQAEAGDTFATFARVFTVPEVTLILDASCSTADSFADHIEDVLFNSAVRES
jgi:hypothetical protein